MTITDLIVALERIRAEQGDLPVYCWDDWYDFPLAHATIEPENRDPDLTRPARVILHSDNSMG